MDNVDRSQVLPRLFAFLLSASPRPPQQARLKACRLRSVKVAGGHERISGRKFQAMLRFTMSIRPLREDSSLESTCLQDVECCVVELPIQRWLGWVSRLPPLRSTRLGTCLLETPGPREPDLGKVRPCRSGRTETNTHGNAYHHC